jgi:COMPASS component BRE2
MSTPEPPSKLEPIPAAPVPISSIPQKRALEDDHLPTVSSPLNPDFKTSKDDTPLGRERTARAKKESLKKRESKGGGLHATETSSRATPDPKANTPKHKKSNEVLAPIRYKLPPPKTTDFEAPRGPVFMPSHTKKTADGSEIQFSETTAQ